MQWSVSHSSKKSILLQWFRAIGKLCFTLAKRVLEKCLTGGIDQVIVRQLFITLERKCRADIQNVRMGVHDRLQRMLKLFGVCTNIKQQQWDLTRDTACTSNWATLVWNIRLLFGFASILYKSSYLIHTTNWAKSNTRCILLMLFGWSGTAVTSIWLIERIASCVGTVLSF